VSATGIELSPEDRVEVKLQPWDDQDAILAVPRSKPA
jgi:translation initiation factor IF-1